MKGYKELVVVGVLILAVAVASGSIGYSVGKTRLRAWQPGKRQIERMMRADFPSEPSRTEKVENFKKVLAHRQQHIRQRLARLKEEDPERYRDVIQKQINRLEATLERLKKELPEASK